MWELAGGVADQSQRPLQKKKKKRGGMGVNVDGGGASSAASFSRCCLLLRWQMCCHSRWSCTAREVGAHPAGGSRGRVYKKKNNPKHFSTMNTVTVCLQALIKTRAANVIWHTILHMNHTELEPKEKSICLLRPIHFVFLLNIVADGRILTKSPSDLGTRTFISELLALTISQFSESLLR